MIPEFTKADWEKSKVDNELLIKGNLMQISMATKIIELCEDKIKEFEEKEKLKVSSNA
jgi:hypothetical protein